MTPAQEFRETRDWLAQHKRDPFLWLIILMPLTLFVITSGGSIVLPSAFPRTDAKRAIEQVSPSVRIVEPRAFRKLPHGTYIFEYDLAATNDQGQVKKSAVYAGTFLTDNGLGFRRPKILSQPRAAHRACR